MPLQLRYKCVATGLCYLHVTVPLVLDRHLYVTAELELSGPPAQEISTWNTEPLENIPATASPLKH